MKFKLLIVAAVAPLVLSTGCDNIFGVDNYGEPDSVLTGQISYQGQPVHLRSGGVELELWQPGYELRTKIPVYVDQDGTFSASVFSGTYQLNTIANNGPWVNRADTITVNVSGNTAVEVPVTPYYTLENPQVTYNAGTGPAGAVTGTFTIGQINNSRNIEWIGLYVATTNFADRTNRVASVELQRAQISNLGGTQTLTVPLPANIHVTPSPERRSHVNVRMGIKVAGISEMIFSPLVKVQI